MELSSLEPAFGGDAVSLNHGVVNDNSISDNYLVIAGGSDYYRDNNVKRDVSNSNSKRDSGTASDQACEAADDGGESGRVDGAGVRAEEKEWELVVCQELAVESKFAFKVRRDRSYVCPIKVELKYLVVGIYLYDRFFGDKCRFC